MLLTSPLKKKKPISVDHFSNFISNKTLATFFDEMLMTLVTDHICWLYKSKKQVQLIITIVINDEALIIIVPIHQLLIIIILNDQSPTDHHCSQWLKGKGEKNFHDLQTVMSLIMAGKRRN